MSKRDECCLRHMLDAAHEAVAFMKGRTSADLRSDRMLALSVIKDIETLGEAATRVSAATRALLPQFPWDRAIAMRHRLVHGDFKIDFEVVWSTVQQDLPLVIELIKPLIPLDSAGATEE